MLRKGETLKRIAHRYQKSYKALVQLNGRKIETYLPEKIYLSEPRNLLKARYAVYEREVSYTPSRFIWPVMGRLTSNFGWRWGRHHYGVDIAAPNGTAIKAARAGEVIHSGRVPGYGKLVILYHGRGISTIYAHAKRLFVRKGVYVQKGERIAAVGSSGRSTGPHLHFEIRQFKEPVDPLEYLPE